MRLAGQAKLGYYPTPAFTARTIGDRLDIPERGALLDPCCGEGSALKALAKGRGELYGIELDWTRPDEAKKVLDGGRFSAEGLQAMAEGGNTALRLAQALVGSLKDLPDLGAVWRDGSRAQAPPEEPSHESSLVVESQATPVLTVFTRRRRRRVEAPPNQLTLFT